MTRVKPPPPPQGGGTHPIIFFFTARIRRMGKVMFSVCSHLGGGVPISHNALQHFPECHGADTGGGGTLPGPAGGVGGFPAGGGTLPGGTLVRYPPPSQVRTGGGTQVGQQKEYSIHGGRYASCVHAGGLSCAKICSHRPSDTPVTFVDTVEEINERDPFCASSYLSHCGLFALDDDNTF